MSIVVSRNVDTPDFDDALASLQRLLGVETRDLAGVVFSDADAWNQASARQRWSILLDYIRQEALSLAEDNWPDDSVNKFKALRHQIDEKLAHRDDAPVLGLPSSPLDRHAPRH